MSDQERLYTVEEFERFIDLPENQNRRFELIDGEIVEVSPSKDRQSVLAARMVHFLSLSALPNDLGMVIGADGGFKLSSGDFFEPDAAFIAKERRYKFQDAYFDIAPDIAVEVISRSNTGPLVAKKVNVYLRLGTRLIVLIYPRNRKVMTHRPGKEPETLTEDDILDGSDVLPGFKVPVKEIFPKDD